MTRQKKDEKVDIFRLDLTDHKTHKVLWSLKFTRLEFFIGAITVVVLSCALIYIIFAYTPLRTTIPGYPDSSSKRAAIRNAIKVDSLEKVVSRWELYSENLMRVMNGQPPLKIDSLIRAYDSEEATYGDVAKEKDSILRNHVIKEEQFELSGRTIRNLPIEGIHFFTPLKGVVSQGYDKIVHPYIDITAPANSVVKAVLDGTVIFSGWSDEVGYTIQIQHENDIVSIYKHNSKLLKKAGEKVLAGSPIALVGGTGTLSTGEHLHFELWYKGEAVDPTEYISF